MGSYIAKLMLAMQLLDRATDKSIGMLRYTLDVKDHNQGGSNS